MMADSIIINQALDALKASLPMDNVVSTTAEKGDVALCAGFRKAEAGSGFSGELFTCIVRTHGYADIRYRSCVQG